MKGTFADWMKWYLESAVDSQTGLWMNDCHPILGEGVFRFSGSNAVTVYERGITFSDGCIPIAFDDIIDYRGLSLRELMRAKHDIWGNVELRLRTEAGETVLMLPLVHYTSLVSLLHEHARRALRHDNG
jgi:hypothetical protein